MKTFRQYCEWTALHKGSKNYSISDFPEYIKRVFQWLEANSVFKNMVNFVYDFSWDKGLEGRMNLKGSDRRPNRTPFFRVSLPSDIESKEAKISIWDPEMSSDNTDYVEYIELSESMIKNPEKLAEYIESILIKLLAQRFKNDYDVEYKEYMAKPGVVGRKHDEKSLLKRRRWPPEVLIRVLSSHPKIIPYVFTHLSPKIRSQFRHFADLADAGII